MNILHLVADFAVPAFICWLLDQYARGDARPAEKGADAQTFDLQVEFDSWQPSHRPR